MNREFGKQRLRRFHSTGGCGVSMLDVREAEPLSTLPYYDLACTTCWRGGESTLSEAEEADDSGSSDATARASFLASRRLRIVSWFRPSVMIADCLLGTRSNTHCTVAKGQL